MGFRFQRRIKILPGITLNVSKSGVSTSIGTRGAHVTVGHGKVRETVGIPGTGISYSTTQATRQAAPGTEPPTTVVEPSSQGKTWRGWLWVALTAAIFWVVVSVVRR